MRQAWARWVSSGTHSLVEYSHARDEVCMDKGPAEGVTVRLEETGCAISWDAPSTEQLALLRARGVVPF